MKRKINFILIVAAVLLAACTQPISIAPAATQTPFVITQVVTQEVVITATPANTLGPTPTVFVPESKSPVVPTVEVAQDAALAAGCSLTDGTAQIQITKSGNEWVVDPKQLVVVAGYNNTTPGHDISKLTGCDMWAEYESPLTREHYIVVLRDLPGSQLSYLGDDGLFHIPQPKGGSFWVGPTAWNTADFSTQKPPIAYEMAAERNVNQLRNKYDWPEIIYLPDGQAPKRFEAGYQYLPYYTGCTDIKSPTAFYVAGTIDANGYYASIGMEGCWIAVKLDGQWTHWQHARDNVVYTTSAEAELFPSTSSEKDVTDWIATQK